MEGSCLADVGQSIPLPLPDPLKTSNYALAPQGLAAEVRLGSWRGWGSVAGSAEQHLERIFIVRQMTVSIPVTLTQTSASIEQVPFSVCFSTLQQAWVRVLQEDWIYRTNIDERANCFWDAERANLFGVYLGTCRLYLTSVKKHNYD